MAAEAGGWEQAQAGAGEARLGAAMQARATGLAGVWRRLHCHGDARRAQEVAQLEGVIEPLIFELGRQLAAPVEDDAAPWARCRGLLRLRVGADRGPLLQEFALLTEVALGYADRAGATESAKAELRRLLQMSAQLACSELAHRVDPRQPAPEVPFGGVVVEIFEPVRAAVVH
jgi:hypothetical protein